MTENVSKMVKVGGVEVGTELKTRASSQRPVVVRFGIDLTDLLIRARDLLVADAVDRLRRGPDRPTPPRLPPGDCEQ